MNTIRERVLDALGDLKLWLDDALLEHVVLDLPCFEPRLARSCLWRVKLLIHIRKGHEIV